MISLLIAQVDDPNDREYLTWLFHEFHRLMFHTAQEFVSDQCEKEEIVQDSFVKIIEHIKTIRNLERYALPFYLVIIVRHTAINHLRHTKTRNQHLYFVEDHDLFLKRSEEDISLDEYAELLERREAVNRLWPKLSEMDQYLLGAYYFVGLKTDEIAKALGCSHDAVRMKLSRARKRAREILIKDGLIYE